MRVLPALRALLSARKYVACVGAVALTVLLGVVAFALAAGSDEKAEVARAQAGLGAVPSGEEVPSLRTEHSRSYRQPDGSLKTKLGLEAVNYRAADGKWKPVDTTLRRTSAGVENAAGALQVRLPDRAEQSAVRVQRGDAWVSFALRDAKGASALSKNTARYANVLPGVSLKYEMGGSSVKETIVLASAKAPSSYTFDVKAAEGLTPKVSPAGEIEFRDATGRRQLTWAAPWMNDAAGQISRAVKYVVDPAAGGWTVRVVADQRWLQAKDRKFPVEVDPTTYFGVGKVCEIASGSLADTSNCTTSEMSVNVGRENGRVHRALVAFDESEIRSVIGDDALVTSADFFYYWTTSNADTVELDVHQLTRSFTPAATWNTYDGTNGWTYGGGDGNPERESRQTMYSDWVNGWVGLGVGRLVQGWLDGSIENHGIGVIPADDAIDRIDNLDGLGLVIESRPKTGADPRATFEQIQPTATSKAKVNVANGNLVLTETDLTSGTGTSSIAVERTINSLGDLATSTFGSGWVPRYGAETTLWQHWVDRSYILEGPGGLAGRFHRKPDGTYDPPPGWNASLVENNDWTITVTFNDTGEAWDFDTSDPRRLTKITRGSYDIDLTYGDNGIVTLTDSDDNEITYMYDEQSGQLQSVGDSTTSRQYTLTDGKLLAIAPPNTTEIEYAYDTNGRVEQITYPGGSRLTAAYDTNGRVTSLTQKPDDNPTNDLTTTFAYSSPSSPCLGSDFGKTVVTYPNAEARSYCYGRTLAVRVASPATSSDVTDPTMSFSGDAWDERANWHREGNLPLDVFAADSGSGVKRIETKLDGATLDSHEQTCTAGGCTMHREVVADLAGVGTGVHGLDVTATDQANRTTTNSFDLKVDKVAPVLDMSGALWDDRATPLASGSRAIEVAASDPESGVVAVEILLDGVTLQDETGTCEAGGCSRAIEAAVEAASVTPGEHEVLVRAKDAAGNEASEHWSIETAPVDGDYPAIQLSGSLHAAESALSGGEYGLTIGATPGNGDGDRWIKEIRADVDGYLTNRWRQECETPCGMTQTRTFDIDEFDDGAHVVTVSAIDAEGRKAQTDLEFEVDRSAPDAPAELSADVSEGTVQLSWRPSDSADVVGYRVYRRTGTGTAELMTSTPVEGVGWADATPASGALAYSVVAVDIGGHESHPLGPVTVNTGSAALAAPLGVTVRSTPSGEAVTWEPVVGATDYVVYRAELGNAPHERMAQVNTTFFVDSDADPGATSYRIRGVDAGGRLGDWSAAVQTSGAGEVPAPLTVHVDGELARAARQGGWLFGSSGGLSVTVVPGTNAGAPSPVETINVTVDGITVESLSTTCDPPAAACELSEETEVDLSSLDEGIHELFVVATDAAGETAEAYLDVRISRSAPGALNGLAVRRVTSSAAEIDWLPSPERDIAGYQILRANSQSGPYELLTDDPVRDSSFVDSAASQSEDWFYVVRAVDLSGSAGLDSEPVQVTNDVVTPPSSVSATPAYRQVDVAWSASPSPAVQYYVYRRETGDQQWTRIATVETPLVYEDTAVRPDVSYDYTVRAATANETMSQYGPVASAVPDWGSFVPEIALSGTLAEANGTTVLAGTYSLTVAATELDLLATTPGIVGLRAVLDDTVLLDVQQECPLGNCSLTRTVSVDTGGLEDGSHVVTVEATDAAGRTTQEAVQINVDTAPPPGVTGLQVDGRSDAVHLAWASSDDGEGGYEVARAANREGTYEELTTSPVEAPGYEDTTAAVGVRYWYRVRAIDAAGNTGLWSATVPGTRGGAGALSPTGLSATGNLGRVDLSWDASPASDLAGYIVYASDSAGGPAEPLMDQPLRSTSYTDIEGEPRQPRYYEVRAVTTSRRTSPASARVGATPTALPGSNSPQKIAYQRQRDEAGGYADPVIATDADPVAPPLTICSEGADGDCPLGPLMLRSDGEQVAYSDWTRTLRLNGAGGSLDVCGPLLTPQRATHDCAGGPAVAPTLGGGNLPVPGSFSPDGNFVYYTVEAREPGVNVYSIWKAPVAGGAPQVVVPATSTTMYVAPMVTADGRTLFASAVDTEPGHGAILGYYAVKVDLSTGSIERIDIPRGPAVSVAPSPSGRRIAYFGVTRGSSGGTLFIARADGTQAKAMRSVDVAGPLTWSPDGRYVMYDRATPGAPVGHERTIVRLDVNTGSEDALATVREGTFVWAGPVYAQPEAPRLESNLDDGRLVSAGVLSARLALEASNDQSGIYAIAATAGDTSAASTDCDGPCPLARELEYDIPTANKSEGTYPIRLLARSAAGTAADEAGSLVVDRSPPIADVAGTVALGELTVDAQNARDPQLADGSPGSGVATLSYRTKTGGAWSAWTVMEQPVATSLAATATDVQLRVVDNAGREDTVTVPVQFRSGGFRDCGGIIDVRAGMTTGGSQWSYTALHYYNVVERTFGGTRQYVRHRIRTYAKLKLSGQKLRARFRWEEECGPGGTPPRVAGVTSEIAIEVADPVTKQLVDDERDARFEFPSGGDRPRFDMPRFLLFDFSPYSRQTGGRDFRLNLRFKFQSIGAFPVSLQPLIVTPRVQCYPGPKIKPLGRRCHFEDVRRAPDRIDAPRLWFGVDAAPELKMR